MAEPGQARLGGEGEHTRLRQCSGMSLDRVLRVSRVVLIG